MAKLIFVIKNKFTITFLWLLLYVKKPIFNILIFTLNLITFKFAQNFINIFQCVGFPDFTAVMLILEDEHLTVLLLVRDISDQIDFFSGRPIYCR